MTEINIKWELPSHKDFKKYAEEEGKECSITEYVLWLDFQYLMLRSLTQWHTGVPERDGRYIVEYETGYVNSATGKFTIASDICFYNAMGGFWVTYYNPIRWAFLPTDSDENMEEV